MNKRIEMFTKKQIDAVELGVELSKHYLYEKENGNGQYNKFASFAKAADETGVILSYTEKNKILHEMMMDEAYDISGLDRDRVKPSTAFTFQSFERAYFSILEEMLDRVDSKTEIEQTMAFAEVRSLADGDSLTFHIPSKHLLTISTVANGVRNSHLQKLHQEDVTLAPVAKKASVSLDIAKIAAGTVDYGYLINQVAKSFRTKLQQEIVDTMFGAYATLATPFKETTYTQDTFVQLVERVEGANDAPATVFGTKSALSKVLPTSDYLKMGLGGEYVSNGYIESPFGCPTVKLNQSVKPNSAYDFSIDNRYLLILCAADKPVKVATEGVTTIRQTKDFGTADDVQAYTITKKWDLKIASQANFGVMKIS